MNKYLFFLSLAGSMLTACSSGDDLSADELSQAEKEAAIIAEANAASDVQIRLGFGSQSQFSSITRAPLQSDVNKNFTTPDGKYLGVFCLAQIPQVPTASPGPVAEENIAWNAAATNLTYLMNANQPASVVKLTGGNPNQIGTASTNDDVSEVRFIDPTTLASTPAQKHYYYPYGNWYNYYFYAYYPYQSSGVTTAARKVTVNFALDGTQDVLWAKAIPTTNNGDDVNKGFNAKYFRSLQTNGVNDLEDLPKMGLTHNLTQLRFYVRCKDPKYVTQSFSATDLQITAIKLVDMPMNWTLTVAEKDQTTNEGKLTHTNLTLSNTVNIWHDNGNGTDTEALTYASGAINVPYSADGSSMTEVGYVMIPTTAMMEAAIAGGLEITNRGEETDAQSVTRDTRKNPYAKITLNIKGTEYQLDAQKISLPTSNNVPDYGSFEAGKVYNIILTIPVPEETTARAELDQWGVVATTDDSDQNIEMIVD